MCPLSFVLGCSCSSPRLGGGSRWPPLFCVFDWYSAPHGVGLCDPESVAGNSSGSFEELIRSLVGAAGLEPARLARVRLQGQRSRLSLTLPFRVCPSGLLYRLTLPWWRAGLPQVKQHKLTSCIKTTAVRPVHLFLVSFVVDAISQLSCAVACPACGVFPRVEPGSAAAWADDRVGVIVIVHCFVLRRFLLL